MSIELFESFISNTSPQTIKVFKENDAILPTQPIAEYYMFETKAVDTNEVKTFEVMQDSTPLVIYAYDVTASTGKTLTMKVLNTQSVILWQLALGYNNMVDVSGLLFYQFPLFLLKKGQRVTVESNTPVATLACILQRCHIIDVQGSLT